MDAADTGLRKRGFMYRDYGTIMNSSQDMGMVARRGTSASSDDTDADISHHPRSLDEFLEDAYTTSTGTGYWKMRYWLVMLALGIANSSDASEILCISYILSDESFKNHILKEEWRGGLLAGGVFLGMLLGGLFIGTLGDWMGRRPILLAGLTCNAVAGIVSGFAPNVWVLTFLRCIAGIGIGTTVPPLFTIVTELAPPSQRGLFVAFCASFWMVGSVYVAVAALLVFQKEWLAWIPLSVSWRTFAILCAVPSAIGAIMVHMLVPESPRFLALRGQQHEKALMVANRLAAQMGYRGPMLSLEELKHQFLHSLPSSSMESDPLNPQAHASHAATHSSYSVTAALQVSRVALMDFFTAAKLLYTPKLRPITLPLQLVWFSLSFGSYGLMTWINTLFVAVHLENVYTNALLFALANLPGNVLSAILMDRIGRNAMLVGSIVASAISLVGFAFFAKSEEGYYHAGGIVSCACAFQCFTIAAWNTIDCMTSELFATTVRATGMGICTASGRIGALVAQLINGVLVANPVRLLLVASLTLLMGALTPCLLPSASDMTGQPVHDDVLTSGRRNSHDNDEQPNLV